MGTEVTTTQQTTIPGIGAQEAGARSVLEQLAGDVGQLGDLSQLTSGNLSISPEDEALIRRISELSSEMGRANIQDNAAFASGQLEDRLIGRGVSDSTIAAVDEAMIGRQTLQDLNMEDLSREVTSAQQLRQQTLDRAGIQMNANQVMLQRILGGAEGLANLGLTERLAQGTTTGTQSTNAMGTVAQLVGDVGGQVASSFIPQKAASTG